MQREEKIDGEDEDAVVDEEAAGVEGPSRRKGVLVPPALTGVVNGEDCVESCCAVVVRVGYRWTDSSELELYRLLLVLLLNGEGEEVDDEEEEVAKLGEAILSKGRVRLNRSTVASSLNRADGEDVARADRDPLLLLLLLVFRL